MSGDSQRNDDLDPLGDDFVIDEPGGKAEDGAKTASPQAQAPAGGGADEADLLFEDHTQGLRASETFAGKGEFAEDSASTWSGSELELDEVGVPPVDESAEVQTAEATAAAAMAAAEETFTKELGALLDGEQEFALDSDAELELVDGVPAATDGVSEFEQSGPFVIDDGDGAWQEGTSEATTTDEPLEPAVGEATEGTEDVALPALSPVAAEPVEPGWEPLPSADMDALAEVEDVARTDAAATDAEATEASDEPLPFDESQLPDVGGAPVLIGARSMTRRSLRVALPLAALLLLSVGALTMLAQPHWFGLQIEPERTQVVQIERPVVQIDVATPSEVASVAAGPGAAPKPLPNGGHEPSPSMVVKPQPVTETPPESTPVPSGTVAIAPEPLPAPTPAPKVPPVPTIEVPPAQVQPTPVEPQPVAPMPVTQAESLPPNPGTTMPVAVTTPNAGNASTTPTNPTPPSNETPAPAVVATPVANDPNAAPTSAWPVATAAPTPRTAGPGSSLLRVGDNLMLGEQDGARRNASPVDGVMPGSRAFAQLHNGNYFIGSVKCTSATSVTLRVDEGEVTLATADLVRLTELGSADYDELQKATTGFVRLTNKNRLVGGILSRIADDHIVLEFRSNRVMLPKSAIGEVVTGDGDSPVRLDVTREEDDWLKRIAERQLGTPLEPIAPANATPPPGATPAPPANARPR